MLATEYSDDRTGYFQVGGIGEIPKPDVNDWHRGSPRLFIYSRQSGIQSGITNERSSKVALDHIEDDEATDETGGKLPKVKFNVYSLNE